MVSQSTPGLFALLEKLIERGSQGDGSVNALIGTIFIGSQGDDILVLVVFSQAFPRLDLSNCEIPYWSAMEAAQIDSTAGASTSMAG